MNNNIKVFIISGKAKVGKDTTANIIKEYGKEKNLKTLNLQFSKYIKMYAQIITNWQGVEETKPRSFLQDLGNMVRNNIDENFFINRIIEDIKVLSNFCDIITISDARLPKELDMIANVYKNSYKINIIRPNFKNELTTEENQHITETALDNYKHFDYIFINDGTINDLKEKVENVIKDII
jgi:hypothetical protein